MARHRYTAAELAELQRRHLAGTTLTELAREVDRHYDAIYNLFRRNGLQIVHRRKKVVFTADVLRRAQQLYDQGKSIRQVAREMGLNPNGLANAWFVHGMPTRSLSDALLLRWQKAKDEARRAA